MEFVRRIAHRAHNTLPANLAVDDLIQDGMVGLLEAAAIYDPTKNDSFTAFAFPRIRGRIIDGVRKFGNRNRQSTRAAKQLSTAISEIEGRTHAPARLSEIAEHLGMSAVAANKLLQVGEAIYFYDGDTDELSETLFGPVSDAKSPHRQAEINRDIHALQLIISSLSAQKSTVFVRYFVDGLNISAISAEIGLCPARVSQIKNEALNSIQDSMREKGML